MDKYLLAVYIAIVFVVLSCVAYFGWAINGLRLEKKLADQRLVIEQKNSEIRVLLLRFELLGREQKQASAVAEKAQHEAAALRVSVNEKTKQIMALKASTCAAVTESQWGKQ